MFSDYDPEFNDISEDFTDLGNYTEEELQFINVTPGILQLLDSLTAIKYSYKDPNKEGFEYAPSKFLKNVHPKREECDEYHCVVHNPSDHNMRNFPLLWRSDRKMFERTCPHGIGHPDPDHMSWYERTYGEHEAYYEGVHGCDGCCSGQHDQI